MILGIVFRHKLESSSATTLEITVSHQPFLPCPFSAQQVNMYAHKKRMKRSGSRSTWTTTTSGDGGGDYATSAPPPPPPQQPPSHPYRGLRGEEDLPPPPALTSAYLNSHVVCNGDGCSVENQVARPFRLKPPVGGAVPDGGGGGGGGDMAARGYSGSGGSGGSGARSGNGSSEKIAETGEGGGKIPYRESRFSPRRGRRKREGARASEDGDDGEGGVVGASRGGRESPACERLFELGDRAQRRVQFITSSLMTGH